MPIYEYKCKNCEEHFEKMQKITDEPLRVCENCGGELEKQISRAGFQFKGSGWYVTDYSDKGKSAQAKGESSSSSSSGAAEKTSSGESTATPQSASNTTKSDSSSSKKE